MRDIKFRAKRIDNGEWVYGSLLIYKKGKPAILDNVVGDRHTVDPETVGQYIPVTNKARKEMYEGDIVMSPRHKHFPYSRECVITINKLGVYLKPVGSTVGDYLSNFNGDYVTYFEIIGNIHTPEKTEKE